MTIERVLSFARQIAVGMEYLHSRHIVHRDLKPPNVFVSNAGVIKICDFGIAKLVGENAKSMVGSMTVGVGTPAYMYV